MNPYGFYWELFHTKSGDVVNSGFVKLLPDEAVPSAGEWKSEVSGFEYRFTTLYTRE